VSTPVVKLDPWSTSSICGNTSKTSWHIGYHP
jgi:hypothetical protein